jgi:hypothetical protein
MSQLSSDVTLTLPRSAVGDFMTLSNRLLDRMHELLERGNDDKLSAVEREELDTLVQMAQFGQIVAMALRVRNQL